MNSDLKQLDPTFVRALNGWLAGDLSSRAAGQMVGMSHQGWINLTSTIFRVWYQEAKLIIKED